MNIYKELCADTGLAFLRAHYSKTDGILVVIDNNGVVAEFSNFFATSKHPMGTLEGSYGAEYLYDQLGERIISLEDFMGNQDFPPTSGYAIDRFREEILEGEGNDNALQLAETDLGKIYETTRSAANMFIFTTLRDSFKNDYPRKLIKGLQDIYEDLTT